MRHVEAGRRLYHSTLCRCCQHRAPADDVRSPSETTRDAGLAPSPSRPHVRLSDRQFSGENGDPSLPEQQQDIPLDTGDDASLGTSSIDTLKGMLHYSSVLIQFNLSIYNGTQRYLALAAVFRLEQLLGT